MTAPTTTRPTTVAMTARAADDARYQAARRVMLPATTWSPDDDSVRYGVALDAAGLVSGGPGDDDTVRYRGAGHVTVDLTVSYDGVRWGGCGRREPSRDLG